MGLLSSIAFIGFAEAQRYMTESNATINTNYQQVQADLINAACQKCENILEGPIITRQFKRYYYGTGKTNLNLDEGPIDITGPHPLIVKVRNSGSNSLDQTSSTDWTTWTRDTDFVVGVSQFGKNMPFLIVNPAVKAQWPKGFRNVYVEHYAGYGDQTTSSGEVTGSTVPDDIKQAAKKLVQFWWKTDIIEMGQIYSEEGGDKTRSGVVPLSVADLLEPYRKRRSNTIRMR